MADLVDDIGTQLIDAHNQLASDCFVMICILRGLIPFAWTFFVAQWVERDGFLIPFGTFTGIMAVFSLFIIPIICGGQADADRHCSVRCWKSVSS